MTGAREEGVFKHGNGGTLFSAETGYISPQLKQPLRRLLQKRMILPPLSYFTFIILTLHLLTFSTDSVHAQVGDGCQDFRVYGNETGQNYIELVSGTNTRIIKFKEVTVRKTGDSGYLVCFPVFGIAPVILENESVDPVKLLRLVPVKDFDYRLSQVNLHVRPGADEPYAFSRSSFSTIDCVLDRNRFNPSVDDLLDPRKSEMEHSLTLDKGKLLFEFTSVSKEDASFSMKIHVQTASIPGKELEDNFRAKNAGDTLQTRIYLYRKAGFLSYETPFGLKKIVQLPKNGTLLSGSVEKDFAKVNTFDSLSAEYVSFQIHQVKRTSGNRYDKAIMEPLVTAGATLDDFILNSETYEGTVVSAELVDIAGDPLLIDHTDLPEQERFYATPIQLDIPNREVGITDLPGKQAFPMARDLEPFRYSLVNASLRCVEITVNETPGSFFADVKRGSMKSLASEIQFGEFLEKAGDFANPVMDFIMYTSENYNELEEKDQSWWEEQLESMGVDLPDSDNPMDYMMAIEKKYNLSNRIVKLIAEKHYRENYNELISVYTSILRMKSDREDTTGYADQVGQVAEGIGIAGIERQGWFFMATALEDSLRQIYPENAVSWAMKSAEATLEPVTRFTFTTDVAGRVSKAEFLSPSGYDALKISYQQGEDSVQIGISHPGQGIEQRTFPVDRGITDIHYLFTLLPWYDYSVSRDADYYFLDTKGTTYGRDFYITPVFYRVNIQQNSEEKIWYIDREVDTYKVNLTFNIVPERPAILFSELSGGKGRQPVAEVWVSQQKPHIPIKMKIGNEVYWRGPVMEDAEQTKQWYAWMMENQGRRY